MEHLAMLIRAAGDGSPVVEDRREDTAEPWGFVVCRDTFLSGWGRAPGRSFYVLAVQDARECGIVTQNAARRSDMEDIRLVRDWRAISAMIGDGDHVAIVDRRDAARWYEPEGF